MPVAASASPAAASDIVSAFGTRRVRRSMTAAAAQPATAMITTMVLEVMYRQ